MKKLYYIVNARIPTEKAHGYQICKMCEELTRLGVEVELWLPTRGEMGDLFSYYNLKEKFKVRYFRIIDFIKYDRILRDRGVYLNSLIFLLRLWFQKISKDSLIITRNPEIAWCFSKKGNQVFYDAHFYPGSKRNLFDKLLSSAKGIICNSRGTEQIFIKKGFRNTIALPNGVDLVNYKISQSQKQLRDELSLPPDKKIIMYVGHLYKWKGVEVIINSARQFRNNKNYLFIIVGGTKENIKYYKRTIKKERMQNIKLLGYKPIKEIPKYLKAADLLLLPNLPISKESIIYTSPIKMFEYMASRRLILASSLPSLKEILNEKNCLFFQAGDARDMTKKIDEIFTSISRPKIIELINRTYSDVQEFTWENRAKKLLKFIDKGFVK